MEEEIMLLAEDNPISSVVSSFMLRFGAKIFNFTVDVLDKFDVIRWSMAIFTLFAIYRFILKPLFGGSAGSSDQVNKKGGKK